MLIKTQKINLSVDNSLTMCLTALKARKYQTKIFAGRLLLCVKRSQQKDCVLTMEILMEAVSHYETKVTIIGKLTGLSLPWELPSEVCDVAESLEAKAQMQTTHPAAFPFDSLQVCIV